MLTAATLGLAFYGLYSVVAGLEDLLGPSSLEWWADLWVIAAGTVVLLAAAFVRVSMPGGLALAVSGLLALQSISLHNDPHLSDIVLVPQLARALVAVVLVGLAYAGWGTDAQDPRGPGPRGPAI
jgi:hypothetical protein